MSGQAERPVPRDVFEKQAYRCRPMETAKNSWRGLRIRDADKARTGEVSTLIFEEVVFTTTISCTHRHLQKGHHSEQDVQRMNMPI